MSTGFFRVFCLIILPGLLVALKLPTYLSACKKDDPKLNECVVKHGQAAIPKILGARIQFLGEFHTGLLRRIAELEISLKQVELFRDYDGRMTIIGNKECDPKYRAPKLEPLEITELRVNQGTKQVGLRLTLHNAKIYGLRQTKFIKANTDLKKRHIDWTFKIPRVEILGNYDVNGQVLILPITGQGKSNVTLTNLDITYSYDWVLKKKNGKDYMNFTSSNLQFDTGRTYFDLKNLFNGDKFLGDNMNRFLNENWKEVTKELGPAVGQAFGTVFRNLLTSVAESVPFEDIYL